MRNKGWRAGRLLPVVILIIAAIPDLFADGPIVSGFLDSKAIFSAGAGTAPDFSYGIEEYANLRMQTRVGDRAIFYGSFNLIAASGSSTEAAKPVQETSGNLLQSASSSYIAGENYVAAMELERLYVRLNGEYLDIDAGLMRLAFGYGQIFAPSDFLNPRNPLFPDARPRGILGSAFSFYPTDTLKLLTFASAPKNPFNSGGDGSLFGISGDHHWDKASLQLLYSFETPRTGSVYGIHRGGFSLKADLELGFVADMLYTYNHEISPGIDGLSVSIGFDYSFFKGDVYVIAEYLYSGSASATTASSENIFGFSKQNYLYGMALYRFNDYTNLSLACIAGLDDISFSPILGLEHELFQGMTLTVQGQIPLDWKTFTNSGEQGELGSEHTGQKFSLTVKIRLRF
jgi:hypothetical protein